MAPSTRQISAAVMIEVETAHFIASTKAAPIMMTIGPVKAESARR